MWKSPELTTAIEAVQLAAGVARHVQRELIAPALAKEDKSPVTVADFAAQAIVARLLASAFPDVPVVGEENAKILREPGGRPVLEQVTRFVREIVPEATPEEVCTWIDHGRGEPRGRYWTLDPIDGTKGYLRGEQYAIALALLEDGGVQIGVLGCPNLNGRAEADIGGASSLYVAVRGQGARVAPLTRPWRPDRSRALRVSPCETPRDARLLRSVEAGHTDGAKIDELAALLGVEAPPVLMDSQAKYAVLAAGGGEVNLRLLSPSRPDYREKIWDQAAGSILVEEAGGRVSDLDGKPLDFRHGRTLARNRGMLATNGCLHDAFLGGLAHIGA